MAKKGETNEYPDPGFRKKNNLYRDYVANRLNKLQEEIRVSETQNKLVQLEKNQLEGQIEENKDKIIEIFQTISKMENSVTKEKKSLEEFDGKNFLVKLFQPDNRKKKEKNISALKKEIVQQNQLKEEIEEEQKNHQQKLLDFDKQLKEFDGRIQEIEERKKKFEKATAIKK